MKLNHFYYLVCFCLGILSCKQYSADLENVTSAPSQEINNDSSSIEDLEEANEIDAIDNEESIDEYYDEPDFVYTRFDKEEVLNRLNLQSLNKRRTLENLLNATLRYGDSLRPFVRETGDGTFDIYMLSSNGVDIAEFYYEGDMITTIQIIDATGVPDDMIQPGLPYEELTKIYDNPVAYGSEIEGRVFINLDGISFRMDTNYGIYEPVDLEDDTEILLIQF